MFFAAGFVDFILDGGAHALGIRPRQVFVQAP
jgi:hypothetical protein